jgi:hypothetical protein
LSRTTLTLDGEHANPGQIFNGKGNTMADEFTTLKVITPEARALLEKLKTWRATQVQHAASVLGLHKGRAGTTDEYLTEAEHHTTHRTAERELMIACDKMWVKETCDD